MSELLASRLTREHAKEILDLEDEEVMRLLQLYEEARLLILGRLQEVAAETFTAQKYRVVLAQVQIGIATMKRKLSADHERRVKRGLPMAARQTLDEIAFWERKRKFAGAATGKIQTTALRLIAQNEGLLLQRFQTSLDRYGLELIGDVQRRLGLHLIQRSTWREMSVDIAGRLQAHAIRGARFKAERIVRTELHHALAVGRQAALEAVAQALPDLRKQWDDTRDARECPSCRKLGGEVVDIDKPFMRLGFPVAAPPLHPMCLPADALIAPGGRITAVSERRYDGDLLIIRTAGGKELACTSNHPVLTDRGWIAARLLDEGSRVVCGSFDDWIPRAGIHHENMPARIEEVAEAFRRAKQVSARPVPLSPEDFHGDGVGSEIAVVATDGLLMDRVDAASMEHLGESHLGLRDMVSSFLVGPRDLLSNLVWLLDAANGVVCSSCERLALFLRCLSHPGEHGLAAVALAHAGYFEMAQDRGSLHPVSSGERLHRLSREVAERDLSGIERSERSPDWLSGGMERAQRRVQRDAELARQILGGAAGPILLDQIVNVDRRKFSGQVYNLETESGAYVANGIVTHNCRCAAIPYRAAWLSLLPGARAA